MWAGGGLAFVHHRDLTCAEKIKNQIKRLTGDVIRLQFMDEPPVLNFINGL